MVVTHDAKGNPTYYSDASQPRMMDQKIANIDKQMKAIKLKDGKRPDSPNMEKPFDSIPKPIRLVDKIVESPDGKGFKLLSNQEKKRLDQAKSDESLGLYPFSDDEDENSSLVTVSSNQNKVKVEESTDEKGSPNMLMQRTTSNTVKEGEMTPFHKDAFEAAGGINTPATKGSYVGEWSAAKSKNSQSSFCGNVTVKGIANMIGIRNATPPHTDSDSAGSCSTNRFAALQEDDEESDATTDVLPIPEINEEVQEGAVLVPPDSNEATVNAQQQITEPEVEGGIVPQVESPQPDGVVSSMGTDFPKAKSE